MKTIAEPVTIEPRGVTVAAVAHACHLVCVRRRALLGLSLASASLSGCSFLFPVPAEVEAENESGSEAMSSLRRFFIPGERWHAEVRVAGILAGTLSLSVDEGCRDAGKALHVVRSVARSAGIIKLLGDALSDVRSLLDASTGELSRTYSHVITDELDVWIDVEPRTDAFYYVYRKLGKKVRKKEREFPAGEQIHDMHTAVGMMRGWRPPKGSRAHFFAVLGRRVWRADLTYVGIEKTQTAMGTIDAHRIDGVGTKLYNSLKPSKSQVYKFNTWFSDDERKLPVKIFSQTKWAEVDVDLVGYAQDDDDQLPKSAGAPMDVPRCPALELPADEPHPDAPPGADDS